MIRQRQLFRKTTHQKPSVATGLNPHASGWSGQLRPEGEDTHTLPGTMHMHAHACAHAHSRIYTQPHSWTHPLPRSCARAASRVCRGAACSHLSSVRADLHLALTRAQVWGRTPLTPKPPDESADVSTGAGVLEDAYRRTQPRPPSHTHLCRERGAGVFTRPRAPPGMLQQAHAPGCSRRAC